MPTAVELPRQRRRRRASGRAIVVVYVGAAALAATGGARPTGIGIIDAAFLAAGGVAVASCSRRARTIPIYVAAGAAALCQPATAPLVLALVALATAFVRQGRQGNAYGGLIAGGLAWAAAVGAPFASPARPVALPLVAFVWVVASARAHSSSRFRTRIDRTIKATTALAVAATTLGALSVVSAKAHLDRGRALLESGLQEARAGDADRAVSDLEAAGRALRRGQSNLGAPWARPAWLVPGVSQSTRALQTISREVAGLAEVSAATARDADLDALGAQSGQVDLGAVADIEPSLRAVLRRLEVAHRRLAGVSDNLLLPPVRHRLDALVGEIDGAIPSATLALEGVRLAPGLLGGDGTRTYLVLFTTPVEGRATSGFPGNFAEVTFTDGRFEKTRFGRISELDASGVPAGERVAELPDDFLRRYGRFDPVQEWRSITFSPDFPTVARLAAQLYPQSGGGEIDGVVTMDPVALGGLLTFTGPIAVPGLEAPLTARTAARFLLRDQYVELPDNPERIDLLEGLSEATFDRLTSIDLPGPKELEAVFGPMVAEGHLQVFAFDEASHDFLDGLGITGALPAVDADFLGVTTSNAAMNKIDLFLERTVDYEVAWEPSTGALHAVATITLTNTSPASGLPRYIIGNTVGRNRPGGVDLPDGWNNVFLTLYTPWTSSKATIDGEPLALETLPELGRQAISTFVELAPGASRTIRIELTGQLDAAAYSLDMRGQPMVVPDRASVRVRAGGDTAVSVSGPGIAPGSRDRSFTMQGPIHIEISR